MGRTYARVTAGLATAGLLVTVAACREPADGTAEAAQHTAIERDALDRAREAAGQVESALDEGLERIAALADSVDRVMHPLPLLRPAEQSALRRYSNADQLARARALGVHVRNQSDVKQLEHDGRVVRLEDSNELWVVRDLDYSEPFVTPDAKALLTELATRFQAQLAEMGIPPYRLEVTSVLRTPANQAALRHTNPNAARGVSTHEFGTTFDVAYDGFGAPLVSSLDLRFEGEPWLEPRLESIASLALERVSARRSRELQRILSNVLIEMQSEGKVMVTLEQLQPVFHMTVATRYGM